MAAARRRRRRKRSFADLRLEEELARGDALVDPPCPLHDTCGGCSWQAIAYPRQLELKRRLIAECFGRAGFDDLDVPLPRAAPRPYGYRNHMEFSFAARRWLTRAEIDSGAELDRDFALGLHVPGGFGRVLDVERCHLPGEATHGVLGRTRRFARDSGRPAYDVHAHAGFWRFLHVREGVNTGEVAVYVVTSERDAALMGRYAEAIVAAEPAVVTVANGVTDRVADTSEGADVHVDHGPGWIEEEVGGLGFRITPTSFFQPNTLAAKIVFETVVELAGAPGEGPVLDLFCGTGTLSLFLARAGHEVVGLELVEPAVAAARDNAARNGVDGVRFEAHDLMRGLPGDLGPANLVVTDPPRAGMHERVLRGLAELAPPRIVSVGCNPKTQAENLAHLCDRAGYRIERMVAVDQFPQTAHVENVVLLVR